MYGWNTLLSLLVTYLPQNNFSASLLVIMKTNCIVHWKHSDDFEKKNNSALFDRRLLERLARIVYNEINKILNSKLVQSSFVCKIQPPTECFAFILKFQTLHWNMLCALTKIIIFSYFQKEAHILFQVIKLHTLNIQWEQSKRLL